MAVSLSPHRSQSQRFIPRIGVIIIPTDPFWVQVYEAIIHANQQRGADLVVLHPASTTEELLEIPPDFLVDQVLAYGIDALICTMATEEFLLGMFSEGIPVICLAEIQPIHSLMSAMTDLYPGGKLAGEYVGSRLGNKRRILCVYAGQEAIPIKGVSRLEGFQEGLRKYSDVEVEPIAAFWTYQQTYSVLLEKFSHTHQRFDAIFGVSDALILAARDAGRKTGVIDDRTLLVGLNGDPLALSGVAEGSLTATVDIAAEDLGAAAVDLAWKAAYGEDLPPHLPQTFQLITRDNVANVAARKLTLIADLPSYLVGYNRQQEHDRLVQLEAITDISQKIGSLLEREKLVEVFASAVRYHFGYEWVRILRWSDQEKRLTFYGGDLSPAARLVPVSEDPLITQVFEQHQPIFIPDTQISHSWRFGKEWQKVRSRAVLPIFLGEAVIGVLDLQSSEPIRQPSLEIMGLKLLSSQLGIAIQNADLYLEALQAREAAERANQLKTRLIANVGHEMRSPLNAILGFSQSIEQRLRSIHSEQDVQELQSDIHNVYKSGEHLMYMINDLLDLSRAEIGALNLYFEAIQPAPFLKEVFNGVHQSEPANPHVRWEIEVPGDLPTIRADLVRLRQVLTNLLVNARKFTSRGVIRLGADVEPPYLHIWVEDTGTGIPLELQEKIFEPFGSVNRKRRPEGIGLGLSITRHLVALHDGLLTLESQPGVGSTFHVYLPLPGVSRPVVQQESSTAQSILLVVSSREQIPAEIAHLCQRRGLSARQIRGVSDLSAILAEGTPQAIAWDLHDSCWRDWQIIQQLSKQKDWTALPVLLFDGGEAQTSNQGGQITNILFKPVSGNTILDWVSQMAPGEDDQQPILVVDDDESARKYYQKLLEHRYPGKRILLASNGRVALEILENEAPAFILLDLMMPEVDGFAVLDEVRRNPRSQNVPVLICSGKLLTFEDIGRINGLKAGLITKGILDDEELMKVFEQEAACEPVFPSHTSEVVRRALAFIHQNFHHPISRKEIAEAVCVSENYLSQIFRNEMHMTPWDYLSRLRIVKAKEMLSHSSESITEVAIRVGFNDSAYFTRVFTKIVGMSPRVFRQSTRKMVSP